MREDDKGDCADSRSNNGTVSSMTGFARGTGEYGEFAWSIEMKSVNARNLDQRYRLPSGHEDLEARLRTLVSKSLGRGSIQASVLLERGAGGADIVINRKALSEIRRIMTEMNEEMGLAPSDAGSILALRGVLEERGAEETEEDRNARLLETVQNLLVMRREEGRHLKSAVEEHLLRIETLVDEAKELAASQPEQLKERLRNQVEILLETSSALPEERLVQEAALLATKADVREELDRLSAHCGAARDLLGDGGAIGRRLDFLCQEFNREANTLCSKSSDIDLTKKGLELKSVIEQMREQIQNIE